MPAHLAVIGAGVIGLELGSVYARLGSKVTVIEYLDRILPGMDAEVAKNFQRILQKQGFAFRLASKVTGAAKAKDKVTLTVEPAAGGAAETLDADVVLVAVGRVPYTEGLGLEAAGVKLRQSRPHRGRRSLRHQCPRHPCHRRRDQGPHARPQGGGRGHRPGRNPRRPGRPRELRRHPRRRLHRPEVAAVGKTEEELKAEGIDYKAGKFLFLANGRAKANQTTDGFVKVLADAKTDRVLGVHIVGPMAGELIHEAAVLMEFGGSAEDLARTCHAHPTLSEAVKEAAMAVAGRAIHS